MARIWLRAWRRLWRFVSRVAPLIAEIHLLRISERMQTSSNTITLTITINSCNWTTAIEYYRIRADCRAQSSQNNSNALSPLGAPKQQCVPLSNRNNRHHSRGSDKDQAKYIVNRLQLANAYKSWFCRGAMLQQQCLKGLRRTVLTTCCTHPTTEVKHQLGLRVE